jgi:hypothetical protein
VGGFSNFKFSKPILPDEKEKDDPPRPSLGYCLT